MSSNMNKTLKMVNIVPLKSTIESLMVAESGSIAVSAICKEFMEKINEGVAETVLCESFVIELSKVADSTASKKAVATITESMKVNESNIRLANYVEALKNGPCMFVAPMIESAVVDYITNKNSETRDSVRVAVSLFENESNVVKILETLNYETYQERSGVKLNSVVLESVEPEVEKVYTRAEVEAIIESKMAEKPVVECEKKTYRDIRTNIGLNSVITKILSENTNEKLKVFCGQYISALNEGKSEESLCESFISGASNWNYLSAVDTELSALSDRVNKYKQEINIKKIMETMLQTSSYYIVPLIEDCVVEYVDNKNMQTRGTMLQRLYSFEYDPFVRDIITLVTRDLSINNTVKLGESFAESFTETEYIYSPIQYIKENECVFNVKGSYFVRKGNSISKLTKKAVAELSESFRSLCNIVNSGNVTFSNIDESVTVYDGYNMAVISESEIIVNGNKVTVSELDSLYESAVAMNSDEKNFYGLTKIMNENFNEIAYIDFVKRVSSKDGSGKAVDVFKIKNNIFVNTVNENLGLSTFYRNVNPIQCRNYINEHMEINVAPLFEDVLPEQEKVEKEIAEKIKEKESYIESLEEKKEMLNAMKSEGDSEDIDDAIAMIDKEIDDAKADYEKYQKDSDKFLKGDDEDKEDSLDDEVPSDDDTDDADSDSVEDREPNETPAEMEIPIEQGEPSVADDDFTSDPDFDNVADFDSDFDAPAVDDKGDTSFDVVKVSYNRNIKTGEYTGKGEVLVVIPTVDANGDIHNETRKVAFYLDSTSGEKKVVINNDYMPLDMYLAIQSAIEDCPETDTISVNSSNPDIETPINAPSEVPTETPDENDDFDSDFDDDSEESGESEELSVDDLNDTDNTDATGEVENTKTVKVETPAETQEKTSTSKFPITLGVYPEEIAPIEMSDFENALESMGIKHSASESGDGEVIFEVKSRGDVHNLKKYFKVWRQYDDRKFNQFFPELESCTRCVNEGVEINTVRAITESKNPFCVVLPATDTYCKMFGINADGAHHLSLIAESNDEAYKMYEKLYEHARRNDYNVEQDVIDFLDAHVDTYGDRAYESLTYELCVPYNGFLSQKLESKGFKVNESKSIMSVSIYKEDFNKAKRILESFYTDKTPVTVSDFFQYASSLNEAVTITIRDDKSGKTVEINTDDALDGKMSGNEQQADFSSSFDNVTFKAEDSLAFGDTEEDADDDDKDKDDKKGDDNEEKLNDSEEQNPNESADETEGEEVDADEESTDEESENSTEDKPKKKFKFKAKKKNESVEYNTSIKLNESTNASVLDYVKVKSMGNKKGQIISQMNNDNIVVHVDGHTVLCSPKDIELVNSKGDTLPPHMKFDPLTLKGIYESYVGCGLFINNMRITPADCQVKLMEFFSTPEDKEVELVIEGTKTPALRKYIQLTENVNDVIDIANYVPGKVNTVSGKVNALIHLGDYTTYKNVNESFASVRTLQFNQNKETKMVVESGVNVSLDTNDDIYIPEYVEYINNAVDTLLS